MTKQPNIGKAGCTDMRCLEARNYNPIWDLGRLGPSEKVSPGLSLRLNQQSASVVIVVRRRTINFKVIRFFNVM